MITSQPNTFYVDDLIFSADFRHQFPVNTPLEVLLRVNDKPANFITTATVKGWQVSWGTNGSVYFGRDLHDALRSDLQGVHYTAKTVNEFEAVCRLLSTKGNEPQ